MAGQDKPVFIVQGFPITAAQRDAGLAVMVGTFSRTDVARALSAAGVTNLPGRFNTISEAVDRLIQLARRRGKIRIAAGRARNVWERVPPKPSRKRQSAASRH